MTYHCPTCGERMDRKYRRSHPGLCALNMWLIGQALVVEFP